MSAVVKVCPTCKIPLPVFAPGGNCPRCLLKSSPGKNEDSPQDKKFPTIQNYRLNQLIGEGGFGLVYRATQLKPIHREVAIKVLKPGMEAAQILTRFEAESQTLALVEHPNIASIHDLGETEDGRPFFAMELLDGLPLGQYCRENQLNLKDRLGLFLQACSAVTHAHQKGIIHRDLKPSNILVGDTLKLIDFGIAKATENILTEKTLLTGEAQMLGTPEYMSPEQAEGGSLHLDTRTDIYSLGAILYELVADTPPFQTSELRARGLSEILRIIREQDPPRPSTRITSATKIASRKSGSIPATEIRNDLDWVVMRAIEKDRNRRYDTVSSFAHDIQRYLEHSPVSARPHSSAYRVSKFIQRNRLATFAGSTILLTIVAASVISTVLALRAIHAREAETKQREIAHEAELETKRTFALSDLLTAQNDLEQDLPGNAVAHLARALRTNPKNEVTSKALLQILANTNFAKKTRPSLKLNDRATHLRISPDGKQLLATSARGQALLIDLHDQKVISEVQLPKIIAYTPSASTPSLSHVALGTLQGRIQLHELPSGRLITTFQIDAAIHLRAIHLSANGQRLFTATHDGKVRCWSAKNPASPTWSFPHSSRAICLDLSPDQTTLIAGFGDGTVAILNAKTGELLTKNQAHRGVIGKIKFLATPERFATISHDHTAGIWKTDDGSPVTPPLIHDKPIYDLATSPCGGRIITTSLDNTARVWDTFTGALHGKPLRHRDHVYHAAFSPDGSRVATASRDRTVRIWDPYRGIPITAPIHHLEAAAPLIFTPDGHHLITSSRNRDLNHWQITPTKAHPLRFAQDNAATLALFDPEEQSILTLSSENEARLFDVTTGRQKGPTIPLPGKLSLRVPQLNPAFSKRFRTKDVRVLLTRNTLPLLRAIDSRKARSFALDQSMSRLLIGQSDGTLIHWDLREARLINEITLPNSSPTCLDLQDQFALVGCLDGSAHLVNLAEGNVLHTVRHQKAISSVILDASGKRFATGSHDNTARLWSLATGAALSPPLAHSDRASPLGITCRFSPDKSLLATGGSHDTALRLWHTSDGSTFGRPFKHDDFLTAFAFSHDGTMIVTGTPTHNGQADIRIWDVETGQKIPQSIYHRGTILSLAFTQDDLNLLSTSQDGTVLFSPIAPSLNNPALATFAEWQVSRRLDSSGNLTALPFRNRPLFPSASPWLTWFSSPADQRSLAPGFHPEAQAPSVKNTYSELRLALVKSPMNPEIIECLSRALSKSRWPRHQLESEFYRQLSVELRER